MKCKKGQQDGLAIAALIILIALFIVGYVLLLPAEERAELLNESVDSGSVDKENFEIREGETLLSASPGVVYEFDKETISKDISDVTLFSKVDSKLINLATSIKVSASYFQDRPRSFSFSIDNVDKVEDLNLFFFIKNGKGKLRIRVNDVIVFEDEVHTNDVPIKIPEGVLRKNNVLELSVSKSLFGSSYELSNLYLKHDFLIENKIAKRSFILSNSEKKGLEKATMFFFLNCRNLKKQGMLSVLVNNKLITSDFVVCDAGEQSIEISRKKLVAGENEIVFKISKGDYLIEDLVLELKLEEGSDVSYNFYLDREDFDDIFNCEGDCKNVIVEMIFDDDYRKTGYLGVNAYNIYFDTRKLDYYEDITDFVVRGDNVINLVAKNSFAVDYLRVFLE